MIRESPVSYVAILAIVALSAVPAVAQAPKEEPAGPEKPALLAEAPLWPVGLRLSDEMVGERDAKKKDRPADVLVWTPPGAKRIRAMMLVPNNTDSKNFHEYEPLRRVAAKHEVGIVYLRAFYTGIEYHHSKPVETPPAAPGNILRLLDLVAAESGIPEFRHAPWITFGKSSRGEFPFRMGWLYPERTLAGVTYHGETPTWPIPKYAKEQDESILYVCANGQEEWSGTWYRHVRPSLLSMKWHAFRHKDGEYQIIPWPEEPHPVIDTEQGTVDPKLLIRKATDVPEAERKRLFWVADRELAEAWLRLHNVKDKDIRIP